MDRNRPPNEVSDVCCHVEKETDAGIIVSGAKVVATGSVLTNDTFVANHGLIPVQDRNYAMVFIIPSNAPGLKFLCRTSYEMTSTVMGSPFDYPFSSRLDENDAIFIMDKVLVTWENVFVYGDIEKANNSFPRTGFHCGSSAEGRRRFGYEGLLRSAGRCWGSHCLAESVLGIVRCDRFKGFAEQCMAEYDLDGWKVPDLSNPGTFSYHNR